MKFTTDTVFGTLVRRYKRFLADVKLENGKIVTAHCTNSGSMLSCLEEGAPVVLSISDNPKRKTKYTWEMIYLNEGWVGVNTLIPNKLVLEFLQNDKISQLMGYKSIKTEAKILDSRLDIFLEGHSEGCYIEIKNVSMKSGDFARFPDSVTARGKKHLKTLIQLKDQGYRAVMIYIIQRQDISLFGPAWDIDPDYAKTLQEAFEKGVEIIPLMVRVTPYSIDLKKEIPFNLSI